MCFYFLLFFHVFPPLTDFDSSWMIWVVFNGIAPNAKSHPQDRKKTYTTVQTQVLLVVRIGLVYYAFVGDGGPRNLKNELC